MVVRRLRTTGFSFIHTSHSTAILTGYQLYHNYFRTHEGLAGMTPAEIAGIKIEGEDKWMAMIQNASKDSKIPV
jgi:hypothetical protein